MRHGDPRGSSNRASAHRLRASGGSYPRWPCTAPCARGEHDRGVTRNARQRDAVEVSTRCAALDLEEGRQGWGMTSERRRPCHSSGSSAWTCTGTALLSAPGSCTGAYRHPHLCLRGLFGTARRRCRPSTLCRSHRAPAHPPSCHQIGSVTLSLSDSLRLSSHQAYPSML